MRSDDVWTARWRPVTDDPGDAERVRLLVRAATPLVRAEYADSPEGHPAAAVVGDLLAAVVDACARTFLASGGGSRSPRSAAQAWLAALSAADPVVQGEERELAALSEALDRWRENGLQDAAQRSFRTCFGLSEPDEDGARPWRVEILVQAKDDPSVLVPAQDVWSANGSGLAVLGW